MDDQYEDDITDSSKPTTSEIFAQLQKLYTDQLENVDDSNEGLKVKVDILESWVKDLTDHNVMLIKTVDELESEALKRLGMLEENLMQKDLQQDSEKCKESMPPSQSAKDCLNVKGLGQIETLCQELEEVKLQLSEKDKLVSKYKQRLEELKNAVKEEKLNSCNKKYAHGYTMTENNVNVDTRTFEPQSSSALHRELESTQQQLCQMEKEVSLSKKKLKEAEANIKRLRCDLVTSEKNAKEMRAALSAEVAEKHDQVLALRKEVVQLEDQLRQADKQTHFKDDIIKELRKEVKVARSKLEFLGLLPTSEGRYDCEVPQKLPTKLKNEQELMSNLVDIGKEVSAVIESCKQQSERMVARCTQTSPVRRNRSEPVKCEIGEQRRRRQTVGKPAVEFSHGAEPELVLERMEMCPVHGDVSVWTTLCSHHHML